MGGHYTRPNFPLAHRPMPVYRWMVNSERPTEAEILALLAKPIDDGPVDLAGWPRLDELLDQVIRQLPPDEMARALAFDARLAAASTNTSARTSTGVVLVVLS